MSIFSKIFRGTFANDKTGDPLREGGQIVNDNFDIAEAALLDRLLRVDSVEDIAGFVGDYDGQQISLLGWHPDTDIGGGVFYWDSSKAKSDHNGGTVFSSTVPFSANIGDYLDGVGETDGSGFGCWIRKDIESCVYVSYFGFKQGLSDYTKIFSAFISYIFFNKVRGELSAGEFDVSSLLLASSSAGELKLTCTIGLCTLNYTGPVIGSLLQLLNADNIYLSGLKVKANNLVSTAVDFRTTLSGDANISNCEFTDLKQNTGITTASRGLLIFGSYSNIKINDVKVSNVSRVDPLLSCSGIVVSELVGICDISECEVKNIQFISDKDADGIKVFGDTSLPNTEFQSGKAYIYNNKLTDCLGRFVKSQTGDTQVFNNTMILSDGVTIMDGFAGVDMQSGNGNITENTIKFGSGITWPLTSSIFTLQNYKNDGYAKLSKVTNNNISNGSSGIVYLATCIAENGDTTFVIKDNELQGVGINRLLNLDIASPSNINSVNVIANNNKVEDLNDYLNIVNKVDYGFKVYLELVDNTILDEASSARIHGSIGSFACSTFKIANNGNTDNRIDWPFDMDNLVGGNSFNVGSQSISNIAAGASNFFHVNTLSDSQRIITTTGSSEFRRVKTTTWRSWVSV